MLDLEKNRQEIRFLLLGNYLEIFKLKNQEQVFINNIIQTQKLLSDIQNRQEEGVALRNDITRYELQLKSLELQLEQIQNRIKIINYDLVITLGLPDETIIDIDKQILHNIPVITQEIIWQQQAATSSINLKQSLLNIEQTKQTEKLVNSERLPSFALFAGDNLDGPIIIEVPPINKNLNYWYVGVGMTYNISSLYTSQKKYKQAKLATRKAIEANEYLKDNLRSAIKTAYIKFPESFSIYDTGIKSLELANQNYEVINNRYLNDLALITDRLDASNSKLNAELQLVNSQINILFNYYNLKKTVDSL